MTAVENTGPGGEGNIDPSTNFRAWLKSKGAKPELIEKMLSKDMDSIDVLREIEVDDAEEIKEISKELNLNYSQKCKFKAIIRNIPNSKLNVMIDPDERKAILQMKGKLKQIELSISNIDDAKKNIQNEVEQRTKLISTMYDNFAQTAIKRKETLLNELKSIADQKIYELNKTFKLMKQNAISTSSQIDSCYGKINKKIDLIQMEQRKQNILTIAEVVNKLDIVDKDNKLITDHHIGFVCNSNEVIDSINNSGHFISVPVPILVSLQNKSGGIDIKWKLQDNDNKKRNNVNKLKVEWCCVEIKDDEKCDDVKENWNHSKIFNINSINHDNNQAHIDLNNQSGNCSVRLQCMINDKRSKISNIKSIKISAHKFSNFRFTHSGQVNLTENGTRIKSRGSGCRWEPLASSTGWNSGKHVWKIKRNSNGHSDGAGGIGVTTNYKEVASNKPICVMGGDYAYYRHVGTELYIIRDGKTNIKTNNEWKDGEIFTVTLDCDSNKISFDINDKHVGTYDIKANKTYYPAMQICGCSGHDYKLLQ